MAQIPQKKFLDISEISEENRPDFEKLAIIYNRFNEETVEALTGQLDFNNINQSLRTITVRVDANGTPITGDTFQNTLSAKTVQGIVCIRAQNIASPNEYATTTPLVSYTQASNIVTIRNITGLSANTEYLLTLLVI